MNMQSNRTSLHVQTKLCAGIQMKDRDSFTRAFIEEIQIQGNLIPGKVVERCAKDFDNGKVCVNKLLSQETPRIDILSAALNTVVEQCKAESSNWPQCDAWGDLFNVPFGHG